MLTFQLFCRVFTVRPSARKMDPTSSAPEHQANMNGNGIEVDVPVDAAVDVIEAAPQPVSAPVQQAPPPTTYDDLFPSLPASAPMGQPGGQPVSSGWNRKPVLKPTTFTRVLNIPRAERRGQANGGAYLIHSYSLFVLMSLERVLKDCRMKHSLLDLSMTAKM